MTLGSKPVVVDRGEERMVRLGDDWVNDRATGRIGEVLVATLIIVPASAPKTLATESSDGFRGRLENWEETQDNLKLTLQRNMFGMHAPLRLLMERKIVSANPHMPVFPQSNLHLDILMGRDETIEPVDIFGGQETGAPQNIHAEMEKKLKM
ncbi:hypothetical protein HMN09_00591700 [Mycena chlorophos]|uniref:Proteasome maturation factor UMP1 n=1 Tax=Mycena chlorophos TaxID=658473 RepID=A0A8H6T505_MYCCL|nr:hypothetical protein HMN09_00591700 [Mycena chlorophos]